MMAGRDSLLKSDDEEELVFDQTGLLTNKLSSRHGVLSRTLVVNSGGRLTIARTVNLCLSFFGLGLCFAIPTATITDLQRRTNSEASIEHIYTARYGGYIFGCLIGGFLFDWYNRQFLLFLSIFATSIGIVVMPFCAQLSTLMACSAITGITMGFLDTGGNVWCLDLWGRHSAPFMQGLHFCFALGALVAPLIAEPFLSPNTLAGTIPLQHTHPGNSSLPVDNFGHVPSIGIHHGIVINRQLPHQLVSVEPPRFLQHDRPRRSVNQTTPSFGLSEGNNATEHSTNRIHLTAELPSTTPSSTSASTASPSTASSTTALESTTLSSTSTNTTASPSTTNSTTALPSSMSTSASTTNTSGSSASSLVTDTGNSTGDTSVNGTDVVQSRMDNDNSTASPTDASLNVTTAVKKPTKPLYAEGAAAKNKWDRESKKPVMPPPAPKVNATATSNSTVSTNATANATANGNVSATSPSSSSVSSVAHSLAATQTSSPVPSAVVPSLTTRSSSVLSSAVPSSTTVSSSAAAKLSVTQSPKTNEASSRSSTSPAVPKSQTWQPLPGAAVTIAPLPTDVVGPLEPNTTETTHPNHEKEMPLPPNVTSPTLEPTTATTEIDGRPPTALSSSSRTSSKVSSIPATTKTSEGSSTVTPSPVTAATGAATTAAKRSTETVLTSKPDIAEAHPEEPEVQTAPGALDREPSVPTTITTTTTTVITAPSPETSVAVPTSRPETAPDDVPLNVTEVNDLTPDPDGALKKTSETSSNQPTSGLTSWILDKFKQNRLGKLEFVYAILGTYLFIVSAVFLAFLCTNPRETRSRQEEDVKVQGPSSKWSLVLLSSLFFFLYMGMEAAVGELLQIYAAPQTPGAPLPRGYLLTYVFWGSFAAARGIAVVAAIKVPCRTMLLGDLGVCFLASVLLVVGADRMDALLWAGVGVLGVGMASVLPTSLAWLERHVRVTNRVASVVLLGAAMGEMVLPFLASHFVDREPAVVVYVNVTVVTLCCLNFGALWLAAAKRGEKYAAAEPDRSLYQLANLDDADETADFTLLRPLCANGDDGHTLLIAGKPRARFLRDPDVTAS